MGTFTNTKTGKTIYYNADPERSRPVVTTERKQEAQQRYNQYRTAAKNGADLLSIMRRSATAQASGRISGGFSGRQDDLPSYISRAAGTATAQSDAVLRTDPVRTQAPNAAANSAGRSAQKDFSLLELLGGTVVKGADEAVSRATSTAAWLERNTIGRLFPGAADDTPIQALNEHFQNVKQENQEAFAPNVEAGGRLAQVVDKYGTSVVSAIPSAALAVVTAGTAPAGLEAAASAASRSPGILSALQASAQNMTKNPQFWNSFFQVAGSSYDEALSLGMSEDEADLYALANGLLSSGVEIGGGLETLPSNLKDSSGALRAWIRGMMEEGREEVVQGAISRGLQNMIGSVGNPLVSATDERAVFNPRTAAEEFTGGAVVGGFLGGGQVLAGRLLNGPTAAQEGAGAFGRDSGGAGAPGAQDGAHGILGQNKTAPEVGTAVKADTSLFDRSILSNLTEARRYFAEYAKSHFPKTVINAQTGKTIGISRIGIDKFLSGRINHEKYASGFHIPELVERATLISQAKNYHPETVESIPTFEYYDSPVEIDGKQYNAHIRVKNTNVGDKYYGHTVSEVTDIEIEPSARIPSSELLTGQPVNAIDGSMGAPGERANQTSLATNGSAGTQSQASVEGTRPLNPDSIIAPRAENVNPPDGLGAANAGSLNTAYDRLQAQSSQFHPEGANAARPVDVPVQDFAGRNVSRVASNVMGAQAIPDSVVSMIEQMVAGGELSYDRNTNDASLERARRRIQEKGFDGALEEFRSSVMDGRVSKDLSTLGQTLLNTAANNRDGRAVAGILSLYQSMTTSAAQATQAASIFRRLSPEAQLYGIQRTAQNLANKISRNNQDYGEIEVDPELLTKFLEQTDQAGRDAVMGEIYQNVADQVPSTFVDKWNAWRYLSMLGNPRTHIRNVVGNVFFQPMRIVKNEVAAGIETALSAAGFNVERTKSFAASPSMYRAAWNDFNNVKDSVSGNKYNDFNNQINQRRRIFNNSILEAARKKNGDTLELEDALFKRITYADTLAGYLTANGFTAQQVTDGTVPSDVLNRGRDYAAKEALKATYQDRNALSDRAAKVVNSLGVVGDAVIPFKRTPANVLARGLTYSPLGLVKSLTYDLSQVQRGNRTAAEVIDNIASGATGSMLFALGAYLFSSGLLTTAQGSDDDSKWEELLGHQGYALELPDGTSVTLDWLAPASMPFFMGAEMASAMGENGMSAEAISTAMKSVANPLLEMSMLQSLNDLLESVAYSEDKALIPMLGSAVVSYFSQAIPTLGGQLERSAEDRRMTTYTDKNSPLPTDVQYALGRASSRVPGWDYRQTPYLDAWGREEETGDELWRILNNFANPAYVSQVEVDRVEKELQRVRDATGDTGVFPDRAKRYIEVNGERKDLTAEEYTRYAKAMGQTSYQLISEGIQTAEYRNMANSEKAAYIEALYKYAAAAAKAEVSDYELDGWQKNAQTAQQDLGVSPAEYIALYQQYGSAIMSGKAYEKTIQAVQAGLTVGQYASMKAGLDSDGNNSVSQTEAQAYLDRQDFTREQKADLWTIINKSWKRNPYT